MTKKVIAFGTFDLLHKGHQFFLKEAKKLGNSLTVVVARDSSVEEVKGRTPVWDQERRIAAVKATGIASDVVLGNYFSKRFDIFDEIRPDIIAMGYDQKPGDDVLQEELDRFGLKAKIVRIGSFKEHEFKSSKLREKHNL